MITSCAPTPFIRSNIPSPTRSRFPSICSAGNLFATTRTSQPGEFGALPFCRYDMISGGVSASRPGQNGHCSAVRTEATSTRKSFGRFCRSVEMMTHRPLTGSLRSSGIEGVLINRHDRSAALEMNRHDVETARSIVPQRLCRIQRREPDETASLHARHRFRCVAKVARLARLDLDERQRLPVARDDVNFSTLFAPAPVENFIPAALELLNREIFARFSESLALPGHAGNRTQPSFQLPGMPRHLAERLVEDLHRRLRLRARQHERRREADGVLPRPEQ